MPRDGEPFEFEWKVVGGSIPTNFMPSCEKGIRGALDSGVLAGFQVVGVKATVYDGKDHPVDSKDIAFQIAGKAAFKEAFMNADPHLIEPIMQVKIRVPEDSLGNVLGDLSTRGGRVSGTNAEGHFQIVTAEVPQRAMYAYATDLRSLTGGRGQHSEEFSHYENMPSNVEQQVIADAKKNGGKE